MNIDLSKIQPLIDDRLVSAQKHPDYDLYIYNYSHKAQFEGIEAWTPELRMCRGLILDGEGRVIARPFDKFFNFDQHKPEDIPTCGFKAYDKFDGSLGISYPTPDGKYALATRGSFTSDQAIRGTQMLLEFQKTHVLHDGYTYLFEIIYPENRIVVDYKGESKIVPLAMRNIETGDYEAFGECVEDYQTPRDNAEGVVLYYENGFMVKVKYEEYVRLHRLVTGVNARRIWEVISTGGTLEDFTTRVPEEFTNWINQVAKNLRYEYEAIEMECKDILKDVVDLPSRKEQAMEILKDPRGWSGVVFAMLDKKPYNQIIWKTLYPEHETPFKVDIDQ